MHRASRPLLRRAWEETDDPVEIVAKLAGGPATAGIGDRTWARFLVDLHARMPKTTFRKGSEVMGPVRAVKDAGEIAALRRCRGGRRPGRRATASGRDPARGPDGSRGVGRTSDAVSSPRATDVNSPSSRRSQRREPASRGGRVLDQRRRGRAVRLRRHDGLVLSTSRCVWTGAVGPPSEFRGRTGVARSASCRRGGHHRNALRGRRCSRSRIITEGGTARISSTAPGTASVWRNTKIPTSWAAIATPLLPATRSPSSLASTCPGSGVHGSRTSSSPPSPDPTLSSTVDHGLITVDT